MMKRISPADARIVGLASLFAPAAADALPPALAPDPQAQREQERRAAFDEACAEGRAQGLARADAEIERRALAAERAVEAAHAEAARKLQADRARISECLRGLDRAQAALDARIGDIAAEIAYAAVLKILGEPAAERPLMLRLCQQALADFRLRPVVLRVAVGDVDALGALAEPDVVRILADPALAAGQCRLETHRGTYETGLEVRLEAMKQAFLQGNAASEAGA